MLLAQITTAASAPATAAAPPPLEWDRWFPSTQETFYAIALAAGALVAGMIVIWLLRRHLARTKLAVPLFIGTLAWTLGAGVFELISGHTDKLPYSEIHFWTLRICAAAVAYVLLRFLDRLALIPLLTRRGRIALPRFFHQIINIVLGLFAILIYGSAAFGWDIDRFLAGSAVVSIVLGLALQESLGNFFSGLVMQASPPFALGNWIVCGTHEGRVVDMTWRAVTLHTNDDNFIVIPNATVAKADIINFNAPTTATARSISLGLEYDVPPADVLPVLKVAALETPGVQATPPPFVYVDKFSDSSIEYSIKFWISNPADHRKIEHAVRLHCWYRLRERNIEIPNPRFTLDLVNFANNTRRLQQAATGRFVQAIESVPLLQPLSHEQKHQLAETANDVLLTEGQILFRQNDAGDSFYIISKGQVDVLVTPEGGKEERKVATLGPGDFFGEMSALTGQPRTATIRATPGCTGGITLVQVEKGDLLAIFQVDPALMEKISAVVARRTAEREAIVQGAGNTPAPDVVVRQQKSILGRMMNFFRLGTAA